MALGLVSTIAIGVVMAAICIQTRQEAWSYPDAVAGALFLVSGVVFPLLVLPGPLQAIGLLSPLGWWIEGVRYALFLVSGVVFPLLVLPGPLQAIGLLSPLGWWIEGVRYALFPGGLSSLGGVGSFFASVTSHTAPTSAEIAIALLATGTVATLGSVAAFRVSDRRAKDRGLLDLTTGY